MTASLTLTANQLIVFGAIVVIGGMVFVLSRLNRVTKAKERMADTLDRIDRRQNSK